MKHGVNVVFGFKLITKDPSGNITNHRAENVTTANVINISFFIFIYGVVWNCYCGYLLTYFRALYES
jgi:hypothetical protein